FKAHHENYDKAPSDFDTVKWNIEHTRQLRRLRLERRKLGERVFLQGENATRLTLPSGVVLAGKPDLITLPSGAVVADKPDLITGSEPAWKVPSCHECRFCDIARTECPERIEGQQPAFSTPAKCRFDPKRSISTVHPLTSSE